MLARYWPFGRAAEIRTLNRDCAYIIEDAQARFSGERMHEMCGLIRSQLDRAAEQLALPRIEPANVLQEVKNSHRAARREGADVRLSALTLVIIHLRARELGPQCEPANAAIEALLERWLDPEDAARADAERTETDLAGAEPADGSAPPKPGTLEA